MTLKSILAEADPQVYNILTSELKRQQNHLELIASENFTSEAVLAAVSSVFTNKYAEGYPEKRYYGGCEFADQIESLAISRAKKLFAAEHVNVQPHCGSHANLAAYLSVLQPGDTILGMDLAHGGHLTHGSNVNISGKLFNAVSYGVKKDTELIDYDKVLQLAEEKKPKVIMAGSSAYPRIIEFSVFKEAAEIADATLIVDMAHFAGLVAAGLYPSPVPIADIVTTTTHKTLRGPRGGIILCRNHLAKKIDSTVFPGIQGGPLMHVIAAKAVALAEALTPNFIDYQSQVLKNATKLAHNLSDAGFRLVSGGTDTHLMLVDLSSQNITGIAAEIALDKAGLTTNKNAIPYDKENYNTTSGLRLGTPAITSRGLKEQEMDLIAEFIIEALNSHNNDIFLAKIKSKVEDLCAKFPIYPNLDY